MGSFRQAYRRGALESTKTDLDPPGRHSRRGALASTKEIGTLQVDTKDEVHLQSTETDRAPTDYRQLWYISEHRQIIIELGLAKQPT